MTAPTPLADEVPARPASTVILLRDGASGIEVHLQQRRAEMDFGPLAYVFPGGSVDIGDRFPETLELVDGVDLGAAAARMELAEDTALCTALHVCAVREVFEEAGILLVHRAGSAQPWVPGDAVQLAAMRDRVLALADFAVELRSLGLQPAVEDLVYVARFITPVGLPRRYDTRFFAVRLPDAQVVDIHAGEASGGGWFRPAELLDRADGGSVLLMPPTRVMLAELARHRDSASVIDELGSREVCGILFTLAHLALPLPDHLPSVVEIEALEARA